MQLHISHHYHPCKLYITNIYVVYKAQMSEESSEGEGTRAAELVEYDEITLPNNAAKASTQPANTNNINLTKNSAYSASSKISQCHFLCPIIAIPAAI